MENKKLTICFTFICKNIENTILNTLNSIYKYVDYWVINDTGSTDNTIELITNFFKEKSIEGEFITDDWVNFEYNKSLLFKKCHNKTDFFIFFEENDILHGEIPVNELDINNIGYNIVIKKNTVNSKKMFLYNNRYIWNIHGIIDTIYECTNNYNNLPIGNFKDNQFYIISTDNIDNTDNIEIYNEYALASRELFFNTLTVNSNNNNNNLNAINAFNTAKYFYMCNNFNEASNWFLLYTNLQNINNEVLYECYKNIVECMIKLNYNIKDIVSYARKGIDLFNDRAEIHYVMCNYFLNFEKYDLAFFNIIKASECNLESVKQKYSLYIDEKCYSKNIYYLISFLAFKTRNKTFGFNYINDVVDPIEKKIITELYNDEV